MSVYYVDLNREGSGYTGTSTDPFSYSDYKNAPSTVDNEFYLKGSLDISSETTVYLKKGNHYGWDIATNGPWRMSGAFTRFFMSGSNRIVKDCIIYARIFKIALSEEDSMFSSVAIRNAYINSGMEAFNFSKDFSGTFNVNLEGCTIFVNSGGYSVSSPDMLLITFKDCVLVSYPPNSFSGNASWTFINCATDSTLTGTKQNCQEGCSFAWKVSAPQWNAPKESFDAKVLYETIGTPPQPGNFPYTGYETDLFGNPRTGIGAGYMHIEEPEEPIEEIKKEISRDRIDDIYFSIHSSGNNYLSKIFKGKIENYSMINSIKEMPKEVTNPSKGLGYDLRSVTKLPWLRGK